MRVELSGGQWAELREKINGGDRRAVRGAIQVTVQGDESRVFTAELEDRCMYALLRRLIVGWSLPQPLPSQAVNAEELLDAMDLDDQEALYTAARPVYDRIMNGPKQPAPEIISGSALSTGSSDGQVPDVPSMTM